jgi:hypothetical protein
MIGDPQAVVAAAIANGLIHRADPALQATDETISHKRRAEEREKSRARRQRYFARGLNWEGKARRRVARPELAGLSGSAYTRAWRALARRNGETP